MQEFVNNYCIEYTKALIDHDSRISLINEEVVYKIIAKALAEHDSINQLIRSDCIENQDYSSLAIEYKYLEETYNLIKFVSRTYNNINRDIDLTFEQQQDTYLNSIKLAEGLCEDMMNQKEYLENENLVEAYSEIFDNAYYTIDKNYEEADNKARRIFELMKKTNTNFLQKLDDGYTFYPFIVDFFLDTFSLEYSWSLDSSYINSLLPNFNNKDMKASMLKNSTYKFYSKVNFIKLVSRKSLHLYLLHEYARAFKCDISLMRMLYKELLFWNPDGHKRALVSTKFNIKNIKQRQFILTQSKMLISLGSNRVVL